MVYGECRIHRLVNHFSAVVAYTACYRLTKEIIECEHSRFYFTPNGMPAWRSGADAPLLSLYRNSTPLWIPPSCSYHPDETLGYLQDNDPLGVDNSGLLSPLPEDCSDEDNIFILDGLNNLLVGFLEYYRDRPFSISGHQDTFTYLLIQLRSGGHPNASPVTLPVDNVSDDNDSFCCSAANGSYNN